MQALRIFRATLCRCMRRGRPLAARRCAEAKARPRPAARLVLALPNSGHKPAGLAHQSLSLPARCGLPPSRSSGQRRGRQVGRVFNLPPQIGDIVGRYSDQLPTLLANFVEELYGPGLARVTEMDFSILPLRHRRLPRRAQKPRSRRGHVIGVSHNRTLPELSKIQKGPRSTRVLHFLPHTCQADLCSTLARSTYCQLTGLKDLGVRCRRAQRECEVALHPIRRQTLKRAYVYGRW